MPSSTPLQDLPGRRRQERTASGIAGHRYPEPQARMGLRRGDASGIAHSCTPRRRLLGLERFNDGQASKAYLGFEGDVGFLEALKPVSFGRAVFDGRLCGLQTPGGTGALRLAETRSRARPSARIWVGNPTWPNHPPILQAAGLVVAG